MKNAFSLIEILIVIGMFAVLGVVISQSTITSIRSSRKSDSVIVTRENVELAAATIERKLRNASVIFTNPPCSTQGGSAVTIGTFTYETQDDTQGGFTCNNIGEANGRLTFNDITNGTNADLTSPDIMLTQCQFVCTPPNVGVPQSLDVVLVGVDSLQLGVEGAEISVRTKINLRAY